MQYAESVVDLVGDTPLVKLNRVTEGIAATVLVKVEYLNPGGSAKDRIATRIIDAAEREGTCGPAARSSSPRAATPGSAWRSSRSSAATAASSSCPTRWARTSATCSRPTAPRSS
ncbi:hypothetical protein GCM10025874_25270 [Arenivirga flava]|uniref:Tryptophan synthase beta chain-like PALP domain-containing protein n=1 Tax=Arenivirga flava TaxID=1930060 RepID=A0AA37UFE1_9MICO|nr:hypothetical protein GCM10025874_25270 [Arenivirga flava]